jgi:hypothetical protein
MRDYTENKSSLKKMYAVLEIIRYDHLVDKGGPGGSDPTETLITNKIHLQ